MLGVLNVSAQGEEIALTADMFFNWNGYGADATATTAATVEFNVGNNAELGGGNVVCGTGTVDHLIYADLTGSTKIMFEGTPGLPLRLLMNRQESNSGPLTEKQVAIGEDGKAEVDLSDLPYVHINAIKVNWGDTKGTVSSIKFVKAAAGIKFDFNASNHATSSSSDTAGDITVDEVNTVNGVVMTITPNPSGTANRYWSTNKGPQLRMYGGTMTIVAPEGKAITAAIIDNGKWNENNTFNGETAAKGEWAGNSTNLVLAVAGNTQMNYVEVTLADKNDATTTFVDGGEEDKISSWDFTKWSDETIANLKADAAASKTSGWSDIEKKDVAEADGEPTETSKDNCFWYAGQTNEDGSLSANGVVIKELKGLVFSNKYAPNRSLAIAVNYPVALNEYAGGAYLWLGGGKKKVPCFTIPNVTAGSKITMEVESHKTSEGRGVELYTGLVADGSTVDDATKIGDSFTPKTKDSHTWTIENDCDVIVYNTNGCHIYSITIEETGGAPVNPDEAVKEAPTGWILAVTNGNLAGDDVSSYYAKEAPSTTPTGATIVDGAGVNNSRGIVVKSQDKEKEAWDTQFWIKVNEPLASGTKIHVEFDYKADKAGKVGTQAHGEPGNYQHFVGIGDVTFDTEWKHFDTDFEVSGDMATGNGGNGLISFAFNLNDIAEANTFYFDNFGVWYQKPAPVEKWADLIVNGNMEGESMECFYVTEQGVGGPFVAVATDGIGKDGSKAVKIQSADNPGQDWDTQFFIRLPYELPAGTKFKVNFDYKADKAGDADTQSHNEPGQYIHWACCGSPSFTTDWQTYTNEGTVASQCNGEAADGGFLKNFQTIAFNLAKNKVATEFIIDNVKFEVEESIVATLTKSPAENPTPYPVGIMTVNAEKLNGQYFDLQGRRVAKPAKGLYIINGKKAVVK